MACLGPGTSDALIVPRATSHSPQLRAQIDRPPFSPSSPLPSKAAFADRVYSSVDVALSPSSSTIQAGLVDWSTPPNKIPVQVSSVSKLTFPFPLARLLLFLLPFPTGTAQRRRYLPDVLRTRVCPPDLPPTFPRVLNRHVRLSILITTRRSPRSSPFPLLAPPSTSRRLVKVAGVDNFTIQDLTRPEAPRVRDCFSGVINFAKFKFVVSLFSLLASHKQTGTVRKPILESLFRLQTLASRSVRRARIEGRRDQRPVSSLSMRPLASRRILTLILVPFIDVNSLTKNTVRSNTSCKTSSTPVSPLLLNQPYRVQLAYFMRGFSFRSSSCPLSIESRRRPTSLASKLPPPETTPSASSCKRSRKSRPPSRPRSLVSTTSRRGSKSKSLVSVLSPSFLLLHMKRCLLT
jgi:hypothetical protein